MKRACEKPLIVNHHSFHLKDIGWEIAFVAMMRK